MSPEWKKRLQAWKEFIIETAQVVVISIAIVVPVRYFLFQPFYVQQVSMFPTLQQYDYLIVNELTYRFNEPERGDIVVFHIPQQKEALVKRVIGLPGDTITIEDQEVFINGTKLDEGAYLAEEVETWGNLSAEVQENEVFVMGDNRSQSMDSRYFGAITQDDIVGKVSVRAWPFSRAQRFTDIEYSL